MATVTAITPFNMNTYAIVYGTTGFASPTFFQIQNATQTQAYYGSNFTYDSFGNTGGVLNATEYYLATPGFTLQYAITGLNHDMATVNQFQGLNNPQGLLGFLLIDNDTFSGSSGNDFAKGYGGSDSLDGAAGNDTLDGGPGADVLSGGTGSDTYIVDDRGDLVGEASAEPFPDGDTVIASITYRLPPTMEHLVLQGAAALNGTGNAFPNAMTGNDANNRLNGAAGNDTISGAAGNDTLIGGSGTDVLSGGTGRDWAFYTDASAGVTVNLARADAQNTGGAGLDTLSSVERLLGSRFDDTLKGSGAANQLRGASGNDTLMGRAGNDTLGGSGGEDRFVFNFALNADRNVDTITDFNAAADRIRLDEDVFSALAAGRLARDAFYTADGATSGSDAQDRIVYDSSTGNLYYDADGRGGATSILFATLTGAPDIAAADFLIIL